MRARDAVISRKSIRAFDQMRSQERCWKGFLVMRSGPVVGQHRLGVEHRERKPPGPNKAGVPCGVQRGATLFHPEVERPVTWTEAETRRYKALGRQLYEILGIGREK